MSSFPRNSGMMDMGTMNANILHPDMMHSLSVDSLPMTVPMDLGEGEDQIYNSIEPASNPQALQEPDPDGNNNAITNSNVNTMTGAGAGPLPTDFGAHNSTNNPSGGSTLTEFTKRRNWSQRVLEELKDFLYILTPDGRLLYASPSCTSLTGYSPQDLVGQFIVEYVHDDDSSIFVREFNESIATGNPLRFFYRFRKKDGSYTIFEAHGHPHLTSEAGSFGPTGTGTPPGFCRGFFMMARPFPTKNTELLDSFLEHKIENERLQRRIADLRREEAEEAEAQARHYQKRLNGKSVTPSDSIGDQTGVEDSETAGGGGGGGSSVTNKLTAMDNYSGMPPPAKPVLHSKTALTQQNLDEKNASSRPDSITDKMARYEGASHLAGATHLDSIEILTGLNYRDGERSVGISTGDASPALIRGDVGIAIPLDKQASVSAGGAGAGAGGVGAPPSSATASGGGQTDKKKKLKAADEYVCTDCGTLDSPEWRKGPNGPKTLCNACGLRWAKKEKKRSSIGGGGGGGGSLAGGGVAGGTPMLVHNASTESG